MPGPIDKFGAGLSKQGGEGFASADQSAAARDEWGSSGAANPDHFADLKSEIDQCGKTVRASGLKID